jgi:hypothetical protein|tara:strand:- start:8392 stop:8982 length:591 start_codon:yes stop_codon:yes gene_type:complete
MVDLFESGRDTKDNLGEKDDTRELVLKRNRETINVKELSTVISTQTIGNSFILGHATNGVLGTSMLGDDLGTASVIRVTNPANIYTEQFLDTTFRDTGNTTADWAVVVGQADFVNLEVATSEIIALNSATYTEATLTVVGTTVTNLTLELQFDGNNWESATNGVTLTAANPSNAGIKFRLTATGNATVTSLTIEYT